MAFGGCRPQHVHTWTQSGHAPTSTRKTKPHTRVCVWVHGRELIGPWQRHVSMTAKRSIHRHLRKHLRQNAKLHDKSFHVQCAHGQSVRDIFVDQRGHDGTPPMNSVRSTWASGVDIPPMPFAVRSARERGRPLPSGAARTASVTRSERNPPNQVLACSRVDQGGAIGLSEKVVLAVSTAEAPTFGEKCETA